MTDSRSTVQRSPIRTASAAVGALFLLVGILGFIPGITTDFSDMTFAGHESDALLLGLFQVSVLHNIVHLAFGVAGLLMSRTARQAYQYLLVGGIVYLLLWLYGLITGNDSGANFIPLNTADDWLHLILGVGMIALALLLRRQPGDRI